MRNIAALFFALSLLPSTVSADTAQDAKIKTYTDTLIKDVTCGIVTEYSIRDVNLFVAQMDIINSDNQDKKWVTKEMVDMLAIFRIDMTNQIEDLIRAGVDRSKIDQIIKDTSDKVHGRYMLGYMQSIDVDEAKKVIASTITEQSECADWLAKEVVPRLKERSGEING